VYLKFWKEGAEAIIKPRNIARAIIECIYSVIPIAKVADAAGAERGLMEDNQRRD
jgi:hypothetical protein